MKFIFPVIVLIYITGCKSQTTSQKLIDPISILPFEVTMLTNNIKFSDIDSIISNGSLEILLEIDSIGSITDYKVQLVKICFNNNEHVLFVNGNPTIPNSKIDLIKKHLAQIDDFIKDNVIVQRRLKTDNNKNYMKIPVKIF